MGAAAQVALATIAFAKMSGNGCAGELWEAEVGAGSVDQNTFGGREWAEDHVRLSRKRSC